MKSQVCIFQFLLGITSVTFLKSESHRTHEHILLSLEGQIPVSVSSRNRVTQLYPQALGLSN
jgi:hypothetical protein